MHNWVSSHGIFPDTNGTDMSWQFDWINFVPNSIGGVCYSGTNDFVVEIIHLLMFLGKKWKIMVSTSAQYKNFIVD